MTTSSLGAARPTTAVADTLAGPGARGARRGRPRVALAILVGGALVMVALVAAVGAAWLAPYPPLRQHLDARLAGPSTTFWLGTDELGRDILSRLLYGARITLAMALGAMGVALPVGCLLGLWAGFSGGWADALVMRGIDILLAFPTTLLALALIASLGPSPRSVVVALGIAFLPGFARLARAATLAERGRDYVLAATALGQTSAGVLRRHIVPNVAPDIAIQLSVAIPGAMLAEAGLSFLGLGVSPAEPSWGRMMSGATAVIHTAPHVVLTPLVPLIATVLGFFLLADGLRAQLDPRARGGRGR